MAMDFSKLNFFSRLGTRSRMLVILGAVIGFIVVIYVATQFFAGESKTIGPSNVANAPAGLKAIPGGQLTPEYYRTQRAANEQAARAAIERGSSAVPTLIRVGEQQSSCIVCTDESANVSTLLNDWVKQGKLTPDVADELQQLAAKNVTTEEYADRLSDLVKEGKITPEQARQLLEMYKKQHANALVAESATVMDQLIKSGQIPIEAANELLDAQKQKMKPADYANLLQRLVREGKISPQVAQQLLAQYSKQFAKEITMQSIAVLHQMAKAGQITPDIEKDLVKLENQMVPLDIVQQQLDKYVNAGQMAPAVLKKIIDEYKMQKAQIGSTGAINQLVEGAESAAINDVDALVAAGKLPPDAASKLKEMMKNNASLDDYKAYVNQLVKEGKITPEVAKKLIDDYGKVKNLRGLMDRLSALQANNASPAEYAEELKRAVQAGIITPEQAAAMMQDYQSVLAARQTTTATLATGPGTEQFAALQQQLQQAGSQPANVSPSEFAAARTEVTQESEQDRQARIQALLGAMQGQAGQLVGSWQPPTMSHVEGVPPPPEKKPAEGGSGGSSGGTGGKPGSSSEQAALIKAGSIYFAVLETAVNSDYPDSPVMATIVEGPYKGDKLMGRIVTTKGVSGQLDRVSLNFTLMNDDAWPKSKAITAYGIDPNDARTVMASHVDYHYLQRFGAMFATSFLQGYGNAIATSSSTTTTGIFGTSTSHPNLSPSQKLAMALGQVGQTVGQATQNYINRPPTVRVDSGVSLGILFMSDVS